MARRLYVYYRVPLAAVPATVAAARQAQLALQAAHAGLQAELLRRPELREGEATLMEVYGGIDIDAGLEAAIAAATAGLPQPRHAERFDTLG